MLINNMQTTTVPKTGGNKVPLYSDLLFNIQQETKSVSGMTKTAIIPQDNNLNPYSDMYGRCGIMTACLVDPLSQIISKIMGLKDGEVNSVGFYYEAQLHGVRECTVTLFNVYDNNPIPWLRLGYTMNLLLVSPFVTKIVYYPIVTNNSSLLSRSSMKIKPFNNKLEETFQAIMVQVIGENAKVIHDKNTSYTALLLKTVGITGEDADRLVNSIISGYTLVNKVLLTLMGIPLGESINRISNSILPCPLLKQPITITAPCESINENDIKYITEESRREITKLVAVFVDLFTSHQEFRSSIISTNFIGFGTTNNSSLKIDKYNLENLFEKELELVQHVVGGFQNGIISSSSMNAIIKDINKERFNLDNYKQLPMIVGQKQHIQIYDNELMCTFKVNENFDVKSSDCLISKLGNLGQYIQHITDSFNDSNPLMINLGTLIALYNDAIRDSSLNKINTTNSVRVNNTVSRNATVTISGSSDEQAILIPTDSETLMIPMYGANLTLLTNSQLMGILVYLDSLRSSNGLGDTRFANLQNEVTHELARRNFTKTAISKELNN